MEAALMTFWHTFALGVGKLCVLGPEWLYVRFGEERIEEQVASSVDRLLGLIPIWSHIDNAMNFFYRCLTLQEIPILGAITPLDAETCAECLRVIGG